MARALVSVIVIAVVFAFATPITFSMPFIFLHGLGGQCHPDTDKFIQNLTDWSGSPGYCKEVGDGACDSGFLSLEKQTNILCKKVKEMDELKGGYNIVASSQGNLIARGLVEFCDGAPPVNNFISISGPHAGTASLPNCLLYGQVLGEAICGNWTSNKEYYELCVQNFEQKICRLFAEYFKGEVYKGCLQDRLAPTGYLKIPTAMELYLEGCKFLPKLNNERPNERNSTYKERFSSLNKLVLIMADRDTVLIPKETSWFGYYQDGGFDQVLPPQKTTLYQEDWIGLKKLDDEGRVKFIKINADHAAPSPEDMKKHIVPYLVDELPPLKLTKSGGASS